MTKLTNETKQNYQAGSISGILLAGTAIISGISLIGNIVSNVIRVNKAKNAPKKAEPIYFSRNFNMRYSVINS